MKKINEEEFLRILYSNKGDVSIADYTVDYNKLSIDFEKVKTKNPIFFQNLTFIGKDLDFYNQTEEFKTIIEIENCTFNTNINIQGQFADISFKANVFNCNNIRIINSEIGTLEFSNNDSNSENTKKNIFTKGNFKIQNCNFESIFWIKNAEFMKNTTIDFSSVKFLSESFFDYTLLDKINFYECSFYKELRYDCNYNSSQFRECTFLDKTTFLGLFNVKMNTSFLWFENCTFSKLANFNEYFVHKLRIEDTTFLDNVSLQKAYLDRITIVRTVFEKKVWFENIQINQINNCDIETIRSIKRELVNTHNQIDYLRFKAYELIAYKKEIDQNKLNWKDSLILYFNENSNYFGLDWTKGIKFIFEWSFMFYILYIISYSACIDDFQCIPKFDDFLVNYIKFTNPLSFLKTPLENSEDYFFPLLILSINKIFVSYGIYQTIQAFRKFGVNGG
ncbi:hypothetical protein BXU11_00310 [Flavobacterium sp. LM5]|uniref:hypothetical protein n=1 Tax=Flavobacterium sp. LM5 TaxID=1938610 RepID=UPI000993C573|nr:hypothetical protein [Flavobacterium sp. LM5]OOV28444.1 hypothetical protein BXU11_00310 [Flavobacterium sp. LM5]